MNVNQVAYQLFIYLLQISAFAILMSVIERLRPAYPNKKAINEETKSNIFLGIFNLIATQPIMVFALGFVTLNLLPAITDKHPLQEQILSLPFFIQVVLALLIKDFITFVRHYFTHKYAWPFHAVHHNAHVISWSTKYRLHPIDFAIAVTFYVIIMHFIGFSGKSIEVALLIYMVYDIWNHTNINVDYPPIVRHIFASPNYHKWHHAVKKAAWDKNFVVMFSFYDLIFGTYYYPKNSYPHECGVTGEEDLGYSLDSQLSFPFSYIKKHKK